ncbi:MAG: hypothetical protein J1E63_07075 [Muribaculaceae bacterium]|nr:hypothetical protein [Muribaculaceae bacterium]
MKTFKANTLKLFIVAGAVMAGSASLMAETPTFNGLVNSGKDAVVNAADTVATKSTDVYNVSKDAVVNTADKVACKSTKVYKKSKKAVVNAAEKTADKSVQVYDKSRDAVVNTTDKSVNAVKNFFSR